MNFTIRGTTMQTLDINLDAGAPAKARQPPPRGDCSVGSSGECSGTRNE